MSAGRLSAFLSEMVKLQFARFLCFRSSCNCVFCNHHWNKIKLIVSANYCYLYSKHSTSAALFFLVIYFSVLNNLHRMLMFITTLALFKLNNYLNYANLFKSRINLDSKTSLFTLSAWCIEAIDWQCKYYFHWPNS